MLTHRSFYTQQAFTQRSFYAQHAFTHSKLLHTASIYTAFTHSKLLHTASFYTQQAFTQRSFYTQQALTHRSFYTQQAFTQRSFYAQHAFTHSKLLHTASIYTHQAFTHSRHLHTAGFHTQQAFTKRNSNKQKLSHPGSLYAVKPIRCQAKGSYMVPAAGSIHLVNGQPPRVHIKIRWGHHSLRPMTKEASGYGRRVCRRQLNKPSSYKGTPMEIPIRLPGSFSMSSKLCFKSRVPQQPTHQLPQECWNLLEEDSP